MTHSVVDPAETAPGEALAVGMAVDVRNRYVGAWSGGFEVAEVVTDGYRVRRLSDGSTLPDVFGHEDVRTRRRKQGLWWY